MIKKRIVLTSILALTLLISIGFGIYHSMVTMVNAEEPKFGGTLVVNLPSTIDTMFPATTSNVQLQPVSQIYSSLVIYDFDLSPQPSLAQSWTISPDGLTYRFNLVHNATFHDGEPLTSADVKFTFEEVVAVYHPEGSKFMPAVDTIETPDAYTVVFNLNYSFAPFIMCLGPFHGSIMPKHLYEGTDILTNPFNILPVGSGPFKFEDFQPGNSITLVRNDEYFMGRPYLDKVIYSFVGDPSLHVNKMLAGDIDYTPFNFPVTGLEPLALDPRLNTTNDVLKARPNVLLVYFNLRNEYLEDKRVRQAIQYGISKQEFIEKALLGQGVQLETGFPASFGWCYNDQIPPSVRDVDKANELLDEAGYARGTDGVRFAIKITGYSAQTDRVKVAEIMRERLKDVGIDVILDLQEKATCKERVAVWDFDMFVVALGAGPDPSIGISRYLTTSAIRYGVGFTNLGGYSNETVDLLFDNASKEPNQEKRAEYFREIQEILVDDLPCLWIGESQAGLGCAYNTEFVGLPAGPFEGLGPLNNVWWTLTEDASTEEDLTLYIIVAVVVIGIVAAGAGLVLYRRRKP